MPDLGEGLTEGEINRWLVAEGDVVAVDQPVAEITTEKAVVEVPTPFGGRVAALHGEAGHSIAVATPPIRLEGAGENAEARTELPAISGTGPGGMVTQSDLERAGSQGGVPAPTEAHAPPAGGVRTPPPAGA